MLIVHTTFAVDTFSVEMFEWLQTSEAHFEVCGGETEMAPITYDLGKTRSFIVGRKNPTIVTIKDEKIALMFRIKYPESRIISCEYIEENDII